MFALISILLIAVVKTDRILVGYGETIEWAPKEKPKYMDLSVLNVKIALGGFNLIITAPADCSCESTFCFRSEVRDGEIHITFQLERLETTRSPFIGTIKQNGNDLVYFFILFDRFTKHTDKASDVASDVASQAAVAALEIPEDYRQKLSKKKMKAFMDHLYSYQVAVRESSSHPITVLSLSTYKTEVTFSFREKTNADQSRIQIMPRNTIYISFERLSDKVCFNLLSLHPEDILAMVLVLEANIGSTELEIYLEGLFKLDANRFQVAADFLTIPERILNYPQYYISFLDILLVMKNLNAHRAVRNKTSNKDFDELGITVVTLWGSGSSSLSNEPFPFTYGVSSIEDDTGWQVTVSEKKVVQITNLQTKSTIFPPLMGQFKNSNESKDVLQLTINNPLFAAKVSKAKSYLEIHLSKEDIVCYLLHSHRSWQIISPGSSEQKKTASTVLSIIR